MIEWKCEMFSCRYSDEREKMPFDLAEIAGMSIHQLHSSTLCVRLYEQIEMSKSKLVRTVACISALSDHHVVTRILQLSLSYKKSSERFQFPHRHDAAAMRERQTIDKRARVEVFGWK